MMIFKTTIDLYVCWIFVIKHIVYILKPTFFLKKEKKERYILFLTLKLNTEYFFFSDSILSPYKNLKWSSLPLHYL